MKICPNCKQENQDQAAFCNFCGKPLIILPTQPAQGAWTTRKERYISPWIWGIVIMCGSIGIGIMLMATLIITNSGTPRKPKATPTASSTVAVVACQQFAEQYLKAPKTAEFQKSGEAQVSEYEPGKFRVRTYVDSQNSFGAMIRTSFTCEVERPSKDNWHLIDIKFDD